MKFIEKELLIFSRRVTCRIAKHFKLRYRGVHAVDKRRGEYKSHLGITTQDANGVPYIEICFTKPHLKMETLLDTICHELAHVATWEEDAEHSKTWRQWYKRIKDYTYTKLF